MSTIDGDAVLEQAPATKVPEVHAWRRWFARLIDIYVLSLIVGGLVGIVAVLAAPDQADQFFAMFDKPSAWVRVADLMLTNLLVLPLIACLLTLFGTPGKWICGIKVVRIADGERPTLREAFSREFMVWWRGLGLCIPLVALFTMLRSHAYLNDHGETPWDRKLQLRVEFAPVNAWGIVKLFIGVAVVVLVRMV